MKIANQKNGRKTIMKHFAGIFCAGLLALTLGACDVALGSMVNMKGPVVTITEPSLSQDTPVIVVPIVFDLKGTAKGDDDVVRLEIKIDYYNPKSKTSDRLGREWCFEGGVWKYKEDGYLPWKNYSAADYSAIEGVDPATVEPSNWLVAPDQGSGDTVYWNLPILLHNMETGDYFFTVSAWDSAGHHDSNSSQKLKVYYLNEEPQFNVERPVLIPGKATLDIRNPDVPDVFSTWIYDPINGPEETYLNINNWITEPIDLRWAINDEVADSSTYLKIELTNRHQLDEFTNKELYYAKEIPIPIPQYGILTDSTVPSGYTKAGEAIAGLKPLDINSETPLPGAEPLPHNRPTYIQIVSTLIDGSGNKASHRSKGFFAYLPDADQPWVDIKFGNKLAPNVTASITLLDKYLQKELPYNLSVAYSKTGLQEVRWKLYKLQENSLLPINTSAGPYPDGSEAHPFTGNDLSVTGRNRALWSFTPLASYGDGGFKIVVEVEDTSGRIGEYTAYFTVESNATPTVKELAPYLESTDTYFGTMDKTGNFDIAGRAQIENDGSVIDRVTLVWIRPHSDPAVVAERQLKYTDRNYANWDQASPGSVYNDGVEAKVWELPAVDIVYDLSTAGNTQREWTFNKRVNIFTDLDIGPGTNQNHFSGQVFLIRVLSNKGSGKILSSVRSFTTTGDNTPPVVKITEVTVTKVSGVGGGTFILPFAEDFRLPTLMMGDKVSLRGTWSDDSLSAWSNYAQLKSLFRSFEVTWNWNNGTWADLKPGEIRMPGCDFNTNGTWTTGDYIFPDNNLNYSVMVQATITDLNGNKGFTGNNGEGEQFEIQLDIPVISRISSTVSDGYYGVNKDTYHDLDPGSRYIDIFLEFNKNLKFFDTALSYPTGKIPYLQLNNGGRAYYYSGNGDSIFTFRYYVDGNYNGIGALPLSAPSQIDTGTVADTGGTSTPGTPSPGKLNVDAIIGADYPLSQWRSVDGNNELTFDLVNDIFNPAYSLSLSGSKKIFIDKNPPIISSIVTSASNTLPHGIGSSIYITAYFNKTISVPGVTLPGGFWLNLGGGNLVTRGAKALYTNVAGPSSISFEYVVPDGDDTSGSGQYLNIQSLVMNGVIISDEAGNTFTTLTVPNSGELRRSSNPALAANLVIDTVKPQAPAVVIQTPNQSNRYYEFKKFNITGLESSNVTVEYTLDYGSANPTWNTVQAIPAGGPATNSYYINGLDLKVNGTYTIAARQSDKATTPNISNASVPVGPVVIDEGNLLTRIGSNTPDGIYGYKTPMEGGPQNIKIELVFRIPIYLPNIGGSPQNTASASMYLNRDDLGHTLPGRVARLDAVQPDPYTLSFTYEVEDGDLADPLDVEGINWGSLQFYDSPALNAGIPAGTNVTGLMVLDKTGNENHRFASQKAITILSGYPTVVNNETVAAAFNATHDIVFRSDANGEYLELRFDRDIYRGDTAEALVFKQLKTDYRIPAVLSVSRWNELFLGRSDLDVTVPGTWTPPAGYLSTKADFWRWVGERLYYRGSNGANLRSPTNILDSDTSIKYVLNYNVEPLALDSAVIITGSGVTLTLGTVKDALRDAEALRFGAYDQEVSIVNDRILRISLTGDKKLPVKGAKYQWTFPNGFVKDFLERYNGGGYDYTGNDISLTSGDPNNAIHDNNDRVLSLPGVEAPVIRIDKGSDIETFTGTGANRQAVQPLQSSVRIDCRTPGSTLTYRTQQTMDNVGSIIWRDNGSNGSYTVSGTEATNPQYHLPNLGNNLSSYAAFNLAKNRPQSGNSVKANFDLAGNIDYGPGLNCWNPSPLTGGFSGAYASYSSGGFTIGSTNYNDGGMIIYIQARATVGVTWVESYEAAYRSVLVFQNTNNNGNSNMIPFGTGQQAFDAAHIGLNRLWIRGGDTTNGAPTVPDFPLDRDRSHWRKTRLLTPVTPTGYNSLTNARSATISNAQIPGTYNSDGQYFWFWVTWKINVNAYIDLMVGTLPTTTEYAAISVEAPRQVKDFFYSYIMAKEHFPVIPGRTTVLETRFGTTYPDGGHGNLGLGNIMDIPSPPTD